MNNQHLTMSIAVIALVATACGGASTATQSVAPTAVPSAALTPTLPPTVTPAPPGPSASKTPAASQTPSGSETPAPANPLETIHLILHPSSDTYVPVGSLAGCTNTASCQGDYLIGNDPLFDAASGDKVGTLEYVEFVMATGDSLFHSPANVINLTGRGQIAFTETLYDDGSGRPTTAAIIGGTGEFLGVIGDVISKSLPGSGDFVVEITGWQLPRSVQTGPAADVTVAVRTIHFRDVATSAVRVKVGSLTGCTDALCQGDYISGNDRVVDAQTGDEVGTLAYVCFVVDPKTKLFHCPENSITLAGGEQIVFTEAFVDDAGMPPSLAPIVGGTGEFLGVTGTVTSQKLATGDRDLVIETSTIEAPGTSPAPTPSAAAEQQTIHVFEDPHDFTSPPVGSLTGCTRAYGCQGEQLIGRSRMLDAETGAEVGTFVVVCFLVEPGQSLYQCPANVTTLTERGQIVFPETLVFVTGAAQVSWPIEGGTGEFLGATGTVQSPDQGSNWDYGDFVITIAN